MKYFIILFLIVLSSKLFADHENEGNKSLFKCEIRIPQEGFLVMTEKITGLKFKRNKLVIKGIALTFEDRKDFEIIDEYVQTLRNNKEFANNFSKIKYVGHSKVNVRGQDIVRFEIEASSKKSRKKNFS